MKSAGCFGSTIVGSLSSTSAIRPAATDARGIMIDIIVIIMKAMMICIAYCMKAIMLPTCITPASI